MIGRTLFLLAELLVLFFGVSFAVQLLQRRLGPERLRSWMGGRPAVAALKGIAIGFVTPFCTYSAIPMLVGMRQAGVPPAGYVAFIVAAPVLDPVLFGALAIIVGLPVALIYVAVAFTAAMGLALIAERADIERHLKPLPAFAAYAAAPVTVPPATTAVSSPSAEPSTCSPADQGDWRGLRTESAGAARAAIRLLRSVGLLLLIGVSIGVAIELLVPADAAADITGSGAGWSIPIAAGLGIPLYFHTELFVPIAASLEEAGVGIGTIVALTIAGAGANVPEFVILSKLAQPRLIATFFGYVFAVAIAGGFLAQTIAG